MMLTSSSQRRMMKTRYSAPLAEITVAVMTEIDSNFHKSNLNDYRWCWNSSLRTIKPFFFFPQDQITITGYEHKAIAARDAIQSIVDELEGMISEDMTLDSRVHARIIGARGKGIRKIMDEFKVRLLRRLQTKQLWTKVLSTLCVTIDDGRFCLHVFNILGFMPVKVYDVRWWSMSDKFQLLTRLKGIDFSNPWAWVSCSVRSNVIYCHSWGRK